MWPLYYTLFSSSFSPSSEFSAQSPREEQNLGTTPGPQGGVFSFFLNNEKFLVLPEIARKLIRNFVNFFCPPTCETKEGLECADLGAMTLIGMI